MARKTYIVNCHYCGKEFEAGCHNAGYCCPEHKRLNANKQQREYRNRRLGLQTEAEKLEALAAKKRMLALAEFNAEARKLDMSYGQYDAWLRLNKAL